MHTSSRKLVLIVAYAAVGVCLAGATPDAAFAADPDVATVSSSQDAYWSQQWHGTGPANPAVVSGTLKLGYGAYEDWIAGLKFDLSAIPASAAIISVKLQVYYTGQCFNSYMSPCGEQPQSAAVFRATQPWTYSSVFVNGTEPLGASKITFEETAHASDFDYYGPPRWLTIDITDLSIAWLEGSLPNYGLFIDGNGAWGGGGNFYSSRHSVSTLRPKLEVTYVANEELLHGTETSDGESLPYSDAPSGGEMVDGESEYIQFFQGEDANLEPTSVIGPDSRKRVTGDTIRKFPWRAIAHLSNGCSGVMIGPRTVATAGHCVWDIITNEWKTINWVAPGQDGSDKPYGQCGVVKRFVSRGYKRYAAVGADYAALKLDCTIGNRTGWMGIIKDLDGVVRGQTSIISGYPGDKPEGTQWRSIDEIRRVFKRRLWYKNDTAGGMSGSPVFRGKESGCRWCMMAVHTKTEEPQAAFNSGTRITRHVLRNLNKWKNS